MSGTVLLLLLALAVASTAAGASQPPARWDDPGAPRQRPVSLVENMRDGPLKDALSQCRDGAFYRTRFSIGHRGAPLHYPEHTRESYEAAARQGAGIVECDVTFTRDRQLVCRHSQCDLHTTTNILLTDLADRCSVPFTPANLVSGAPATARCCTSDISQAEFRTLCGRQDVVNPAALTPEQYLHGGDDAPACGTLMTHAESIELFRNLGVDMTPELKAASVPMPYQGDYTQQDYAQQMIDEYRAAGVPPGRVWPQSFDLGDVRYWIESAPEFASQAVYLDGRDAIPGFDPNDVNALNPSMQALADAGVRILAPPLWMLLSLDDQGSIVPSAYARAARAAGLDLIAWSLERSGPLVDGGGYYYQSIRDALDRDGDTYQVLDVLAREVGVIGVFSDWPATVTYYANCMDV